MKNLINSIYTYYELWFLWDYKLPTSLLLFKGVRYNKLNPTLPQSLYCKQFQQLLLCNKINIRPLYLIKIEYLVQLRKYGLSREEQHHP